MIARNSGLANEFSHFLSSLQCGSKFCSPTIQLFLALNFPVIYFPYPFKILTKPNVGGNGSGRLCKRGWKIIDVSLSPKPTWEIVQHTNTCLCKPPGLILLSEKRIDYVISLVLRLTKRNCIFSLHVHFISMYLPWLLYIRGIKGWTNKSQYIYEKMY